MVISCPSCKRKYQIDTSRIPAAGTSFTCWSCRASVHVAPPGSQSESDASASPASQPGAFDLEESFAGARSGESKVPASAMRFFESLAAEATLNKHMESGMAGEPVGAPPPVPATAAHVAAPPPVSTEPAAEPFLVTRRPDAFAGDDILELPSLDPIIPEGPEHLNNVLELHDAIDTRPMASEPPSYGAPTNGSRDDVTTAPIASAPAPPPFQSELPPPPSSRATLDFATPFGASRTPGSDAVDTPPRIAPSPRPITLPDRTPTIAPLSGRTEIMSSQPIAPFAPAASNANPISPFTPVTPVPAEPEPMAPIPQPNRVSPAEFAQTYSNTKPVTPWVAPEVEGGERKPKRRVGPFTIAALILAGLGLFLVWQFLVRNRTQPAPSPQVASSQTPTPATPPDASRTTTEAPKTPPADQKGATDVSAHKPPPGSGGFTIQVRSSPNEADSSSFANDLKGAGFDAYVMRVDLGAKGVWYRVRVGRFESKADAAQALSKLRSSGRSSDGIIQQYENP